MNSRRHFYNELMRNSVAWAGTSWSVWRCRCAVAWWDCGYTIRLWDWSAVWLWDCWSAIAWARSWIRLNGWSIWLWGCISMANWCFMFQKLSNLFSCLNMSEIDSDNAWWMVARWTVGSARWAIRAARHTIAGWNTSWMSAEASVTASAVQILLLNQNFFNCVQKLWINVSTLWWLISNWDMLIAWSSEATSMATWRISTAEWWWMAASKWATEWWWAMATVRW